MNTEKIQAFVNVVECGSFSSAARKQHKAQSWISNAVADLEIDLNLTLFDRSGYKPILTAEGQALLLHAKNILTAEKTLINRAQHLSEGLEERIVIAIDDWLINDEIRALFVEFNQHFPTVELVVKQQLSQDIVFEVKNNLIDIALITGRWIFKQNIRFQTLGYLETSLICAQSSPLVDLTLAHTDLIGTKQISRASNYNLEHKYLDLSGVERIMVGDMETVITLVEQDIGWAFVPRPIAENHSTRVHTAKTQVSEKGHLLRVELVTSELRANGIATQWLKNKLAEISSF
ncbi:transcriptional regulator [Vibrio ishigakensis]|uniref:Transcriptional regulator n=1 Tax=Vibrio ishigakensis TaxID=1481914 RepID=A0A0B8QSF7_9VIBR|nr:transcriptional regulator [Vibrio ishigakensis]